MVEIALSLAIIAIALLAIAGILPAGLQVQKENRQDTIVLEDGNYLLDTIRNGSEGVFTLSNHVESITISNAPSGTVNTYSADDLGNNWTSERILGLLSTPQWTLFQDPNGFRGTNTVFAVVKALSGSALEQSPGLNEIAFRYRITAELSPYSSVYFGQNDRTLAQNLLQMPGGMTELNRQTQLEESLFKLRLTFQWPYRPNNSVGNKELQLSSLVAGSMRVTNDVVTQRKLYFLDPTSFKRFPRPGSP